MVDNTHRWHNVHPQEWRNETLTSLPKNELAVYTLRTNLCFNAEVLTFYLVILRYVMSAGSGIEHIGATIILAIAMKTRL